VSAGKSGGFATTMPSAINRGCHPIFTSKFRSVTLRPSAVLARCSSIGRNQFQSQTSAATTMAAIKTTGMTISNRRFVVMLFRYCGQVRTAFYWLMPINRDHGTRSNGLSFPPYSVRLGAETDANNAALRRGTFTQASVPKIQPWQAGSIFFVTHGAAHKLW